MEMTVARGHKRCPKKLSLDLSDEPDLFEKSNPNRDAGLRPSCGPCWRLTHADFFVFRIMLQIAPLAIRSGFLESVADQGPVE